MLPVDRTSVIVRLMSGIFIAALVTACAAPAAAPAATPVPPTPTPSSMDVAHAYESAWNTFDVSAVTTLFAEPFNTDYGFPMTDKTAWSEGWPYGMARGMGMTIALHDCEVSGDTVTCKVASQLPCFTMDVIEALTVQDGKIVKLEHRGIPAEDARWDAYSTAVEKWAKEQGLAEWQSYSDEVAKGTYGYEWGAAFVSLCKQYEAAMQAQVQDPIAVIQAWFDALNAGDLNGALALMTSDARIPNWGSARNTLDWWIDIETQNSAPECQAQGNGMACTFNHDDSCVAAFGAAGGLPVRFTFAFEDGKIKQVYVEEIGSGWADYGKWVGEELTWAGANRAEELAKIDFDTLGEGGDIAIKLCQEYAETLK